jgi:hypothetical protein
MKGKLQVPNAQIKGLSYEDAFSQAPCAFGLQESFKNMSYLALVAVPWLLLPSSLSAQACHEPKTVVKETQRCRPM